MLVWTPEEFVNGIFVWCLVILHSIQAFEGPVQRLRLSYRASNLSSGLLTMISTMVGHSFLSVVTITVLTKMWKSKSEYLFMK